MTISDGQVFFLFLWRSTLVKTISLDKYFVAINEIVFTCVDGKKKTCLSVIDEDQNYSAKKKIGPALPAGPRCVFQCHPAFVNKNGKLSAKKSNLSAKSTLSGKKRRYLYNSDHFLKNKLISDFFVGLFPLVKFFLLDFKSLIL